MPETDKIARAVEQAEKSGITATVKYNEPLRNHTTFRIGGAVRAMYFPESSEDFIRLYEILNDAGISPFIIGKGSNILATDENLNIVVINTVCMAKTALTDTVITADCGATLREIATYARDNSLTGFEFAYGIPGTLGGAVVMNAGAYGGEMKDVVIETTAYNAQRGKYMLTGDGHGFAYRSSVFQGSDDVILSSKIKLKQGDKGDIATMMLSLEEKRRGSQPLDKPSAGSTFKRPQGAYAAALIEEAGLKGFTIGSAQVSPKHAGFVVNTGNATFADVISLIEYIQETVETKTGILLEPEVKIWKS